MSAKRIKLRRKKEDRPLVVEQWIEVEVVAGVTRTTRYPGDEEVQSRIDQKQESGRSVDLVYRRFNFVHGVPPEYEWTTDDPQQRLYGGHCIQRLRPADWLVCLKEEAGGHLVTSPYGMPRPEARGGCECPGCLAMTARIQREGR